jgi:exodeoxyribonuclease V gamma subunit
MSLRPLCFYSNLVEDLYEKFRDLLLQENSSFFSEKIVVVPSLAMKRWLSLRLARDIKAGAAFNIKFLYLSKSVPLKMPSKLELALRIEMELLKNKDTGLWPDLFDYLKIERSHRKLTALCFETAALFLQYAETAELMIEEWLQTPSCWQAWLWKIIFGQRNPYKELLDESTMISSNKQLHLFCLSFIPKFHLTYFSKLKHQVYIYALSPTAYFWTDLRSRSESSWIINFFKEKNIKEEEREQLLTYLLNTNSLLADFGRVGRKFFSLLEDFDFEVLETYKIETALKNNYDALIVNDLEEINSNSKTLLSALKTDLLLMKSKEDIIEIDFDENDESLQVHASSSPFREIESLYNTLLDQMSKRGFKEEEVLVMAPNIARYAPFIEAVFASKNSKLDYQILDLKISSQNNVAKGFELFLNLIDSRFSLHEIKKFFYNTSFLKRHNFTEDDLLEIDKIVKILGITWGQDKAHRKRVFGKIYGQTDFEVEESRTWKEGLDLLIKSMVMLEADSVKVELSQSELLGRWIELLYTIMEDLSFLEDAVSRTLKEWADIFISIVDKYFDGNKDDVYGYIQSFSRLKLEGLFSIDLILYYLKERLTEESAISFDNKVSAVRFCSLLPMRAVPAKIICLLGLDDLSFPRKQKKNPLDERCLRKDADYLPTSGEYDRYLFLEAILSAREILILSYSKTDPSESVNPSELVKEIINYSFEVHKKEIKVVNHYLDPFNKTYFDGRVYDSQFYEMAKACYNKDKKPLKASIEQFFIKQANPSWQRVIDIRDLQEVISKPIKFYVEKVLGLKVSFNEDQGVQEPLTLDRLTLHKIKRAALKYPLKRILEVSEKRKILPAGIFKDLSKKKIEDLVLEIQSNLKNFQIDPLSIKTLYLEEKCKKRTEFNKMTLCPKVVVELDSGPVSIVGRIEDVCSKGIISIRDYKFENFIKELPKLLIYSSIATESSKTDIFMCLDGKKKSVDNSGDFLKSLLSYYEICLTNPSPLTPKSIKDILDDKLAIKEDEYDDYLSLIDLSKVSIDEKWLEVTKNVFGGIKEVFDEKS